MLSSFSWPKDGAVVIRTMSGWSCISARRAVAVRGCEAISTSRIDLFVFLFFLQTSRLVLSQIRFLRNCDSGSLGYLGLLELSVRLEIELLSRQIDSFRGIDFLKGINSNEGMGP